MSEQMTEEAAKIVYAAMQKFRNGGDAYPWVEGGNSLAQDEARQAARKIAALTPAPRVVVTDWYVTVDKGGYSYMGHAERNRADVEEEAKLLDDAYPKYAPHRVARVALVSEEDFTEAPADGA